MYKLFTKQFLEGSDAIAKTIALASPDVVSAYPITPQTHIVEGLAYLKGQDKINCQYLYAESEFAAISNLLGASATGSRVYTATTSQGLLLMTEALYNFSGLRLAGVMTVANRAIGAPLNIWNDQSDIMAVRDSGWLTFFAETLDEAILMHLSAFKISEQLQIPVMVNMDGFLLTHVAEVVNLPTQALVKKFLPKYKAPKKLDPKKPLTIGAYADPKIYTDFRQDLHNAIKSSEKVITKTWSELNKFDQNFPKALATGYKLAGAETIIIASGSVMGTVKDAIDEMRKKGQKIGAISLHSLRPFPTETLALLTAKAKNIAVLDKSIVAGRMGTLALEVSSELPNKKIKSFIAGLGGKDITLQDIATLVKKAQGKNAEVVFL